MTKYLRSVLCASVFAVCCISCSTSGPTDDSPETDSVVQESVVNHAFQITWPLEDPQSDRQPTSRSLLHGQLSLRTTELGTVRARSILRITLTRPDDSASRRFWNDRLRYEQYGWMEKVRVWDGDHTWLYPNLAYLFNLHGTDRVGRYGGWDPGKQVDNDFGAVLIRLFGPDGETECLETKLARMALSPLSCLWCAC